MRGRFAWEYKGKHKDLAAAYQQLPLYREDRVGLLVFLPIRFGMALFYRFGGMVAKTAISRRGSDTARELDRLRTAGSIRRIGRARRCFPLGQWPVGSLHRPGDRRRQSEPRA